MSNSMPDAKRPTACVPVCNYFVGDNRVMRSCRVLREEGYDVRVMAVGRGDLPEREELEQGIVVRRFRVAAARSLRKAAAFGSVLGYGRYIRAVARFIRKTPPDLLHLNDWETVVAARLANAFGRIPTVYDMHEFFQDVQSLHYPRILWPIITRIDRYGLRHSDAVICVSQPIASNLRQVTDRPVHVVRNIPDCAPGHGPSSEPEQLALFEDGRKHLIYLGALGNRMDWLWFFGVLQRLPAEFVLDFFSPASAERTKQSDWVASHGLESRIHFHDPLPHEILFTILPRGYAGLSLLMPTCRKLDYALPNKLFECFLAGLPVISTDIKAQGEVIRKTGFGLVIPQGDTDETVKLIRDWSPRRITLADLEQHELTWQQESKKLQAVYGNVTNGS